MPSTAQTCTCAGFLSQLTPCVVAVEPCGSAHYWARELRKLGHDAPLIAPQFVKPYVKGDKHDAHDAEAICEATSRPGMRYVPVKKRHKPCFGFAADW